MKFNHENGDINEEKINKADEYNSLGVALGNDGKFQEALDLFLRALEYDSENDAVKPNIALAYAQLAKKEFDNGNCKGALEYFSQAREYSYEEKEYKSNVAAVYNKLGNQALDRKDNKEAFENFLIAANASKVGYRENALIAFCKIPENDWDIATWIPKVAALLGNGDESGYLNAALISMIALQKCNANEVLQQLAVQEQFIIAGLDYKIFQLTTAHIKVIDNILKGSTSISYLGFLDIDCFNEEASTYLCDNFQDWKSVAYLACTNFGFVMEDYKLAECSHYMHIPKAKPFKESPQLAALFEDAKEKRGAEILTKYDVETLKQGCMGRFKPILEYEGNGDVGRYMKSLIFNAAVAHLHLNCIHSTHGWLPEEVIEHLLKTFVAIDGLCIMAKGCGCI